MKKLSMLFMFIFIFGLSATGQTSEECPVFENTFLFERSTKKPETKLETFQCTSGEFILMVYNGAGEDEAIKVSSATISINGNEVIGPSSFNQHIDYIETTVDLIQGDNSLEVVLKSKPGGKIKVAIVGPDSLALGDPNQQGIDDMCHDDGMYPSIEKVTISLESKLYGEMAVSGKYIYVSNYDENTVSVIQTPENNVIGTIGVGDGPLGVSVTPDGGHVYVSNHDEDTVSVIQTLENSVIGTIGVGDGPLGVSVTPDGKYVYVSNYFEDTVSVIQTSDNTVIDTIVVGDGPFGVSVSPHGCGNYHVYVSNYYEDTVSVIQPPENTEIYTIVVGDGPHGVSVAPDGEYVYVSNFNDNTVSIIRTSDNSVTVIPVGSLPYGISVTPCGDYVYVNNYNSDTVSVIRTSDNTVIDTIEVGDGPRGGIAVSPDGEHVYVGNCWDKKVTVIGY